MRQSNALAVTLALVTLDACGREKAAVRGDAPTGSSASITSASASAATPASSVTPIEVVATPAPHPAPSGAPLPTGSAAGEAPSADGPLRGGPSVACYDRFTPSGAPHVDVLKLGVSCGPSNGLSLIGRMNGTVGEAQRPALYQWEADRRDCFRLFAVAAEPVEDLEVEVVRVAPHAERVSLTNQNRRWVVVDEDGPFCAAHAGTYEARFSTHGGHGALSAAIWKGARMGPPRGKL